MKKSSLSTWIYNITRNTLIDHQRSMSIRNHEEIPETLADDSPDMLDNLIMEQEQERLADALEKHGVEARVLTAVEMNKFAEYFTRDTADRYLNEGKVVFFAAGTGNPYFSTDTGAVLRGVEIEADAILMAKNVDGIYSADPNVDPNAVKFDELTYDEVLARHLKATDTTAMTLAMDNHMTMVCFALADPQNIFRVVCGEKIGTTVKED